jgi:hypothetical protein
MQHGREGWDDTLDTEDGLKPGQLEAVINLLPDVERSRVLFNDLGQIAEIHVLAGDGRPAKQIVRDIESVLAVRFGLRIDHKVVSVAQLRGVGAARAPDLVVQSYRMDLDPVDRRMTAGVTLLVDGDPERPVTGQYSTGYLPSQQVWAVVQATLEAINHVLGQQGRVVARDLRHIPLGDGQAVVVAVARLDGRQREELGVGAAPDLGDPHAAAVGATLSAYRQLIRPEPVR